MNELSNDQALQEIAATFRCHPNMAPVIADRIRERLGQPVSNDEIVRVMKTITPSRLSVETVVAKLEKQAQRKPRTRSAPDKPSKSSAKLQPPDKKTSAARPPRPRPSIETTHEKATLRDQLETLLDGNWKRAAAEKLATPDMDVDEFIKAVRSYTGHKDAPLRRILNAAAALNQEDVLLTAHVVADRVNEVAMRGDETGATAEEQTQGETLEE